MFNINIICFYSLCVFLKSVVASVFGLFFVLATLMPGCLDYVLDIVFEKVTCRNNLRPR